MPRALGFTTVTVLKALDEGHRYGAQIMEATGHGGGTVYKILRRLERSGLVAGHWEDPSVAEAERRPRRRYYRLTPAGGAALESSLRRFAALVDDAVPGEA
ncbi:MAG: helix-turn-helix transcriptional regulator [Gemmatimonadota bacterium]|jgi:DNA-binding PadR family transcriptional regulator